MRIHRLEIAAFGPFRDPQQVDLDALGAGGLFLLHGATGAGKTSVLDAVCFALYGQVPGARAAVTRLRSDHAAPGESPQVVCEFSVGPRRFEVRRSPAWERPKRRGRGTTTEQARVLLRELVEGQWQVRSARIDESAHLIEHVIGMGPDQFTKLVLLPQGEFAAFLRADAETRRRLLERLFGTDRFTAVQAWLRDHRTTLRAEVDEANRVTAALLARATQAASPAVRPGAQRGSAAPDGDVDSAVAEPLHWLARLREGVEHARTEAIAQQMQAQARTERAETRLDQAEAMAQLAAELESLTERQQALDAGHHAMQETRNRLHRAQRAQALAPMLGSLRSARSRLQECRNRDEQARRRLSGLLGGDLPVDLSVTLDRLRTTLVRLDELTGDVAELDELDRTGRELVRASSVEQARLDRRSDELTVEVERLRRSVTTTREHAHGARQHYLDLRERRLDGIAAELAAALVDGEPCRVCGSIEHPAPAAPSPGDVDAAQEEQARLDHESLAEQVSALTEQRLRVEAELAAVLARQEQHHRETDQALARAEARAVTLRQRVTALCDGDPVEFRRRVTTQLEALQETVRTGERHREALSAWEAVAGAAAQAAEQGGFADLDAALAAALDEEHYAALERESLSYQVEHESVHEQLADERFTALHTAPALGVGPADLAALQHDVAQARLGEQQAARFLALCENAAEEIERLAGELGAHLRATVPLLERFRAADDLARCADGTGGDNTRRMSLSAYVLAARLEQVAAAASERLATMSGGRYSLLHTDEGERGRVRSGLGLEVLDAWTGRRRETASLSGGESFYTSLALALGLADVVSAEAGGVSLDTLFVDEGFGALDEDTLEEVMDVLDGLRSGGRTVAVVSHLPDLRVRIPTRLEVLKTPQGSTLRAAAS